MNRLYDLRKTLPKNLEGNKNYRDVEFLLLDYGSSDGVGDWVRSEMSDYLNSGKLVYYRTEAKYFCPNHSRNVCFRLATGEVVANVDTDNYTHDGFVSRINECASAQESGLIIVPENFLRQNSLSISLKGRFAMYKKDIEWLRGFDEELDHGYGFDDMNFLFRAMWSGFRIVRFETFYNADRIETPLLKRCELIDTESIDDGHHRNVIITYQKLRNGKMAVNDLSWGKATVTKNFSEKIELT